MFLHRLGLLLLLMCFYASFDYWRHKQHATRWKEYLFILSCACIAAVVGVVNDSVTVQISPAYFVYGKGLPFDDELMFHAQCLGGQAGMVAGLIIGGVLLLTTSVEAPFKAAYAWVAGMCLCALLSAGLGFVVVPLIMESSDMLNGLTLTAVEKRSFNQVWGVHLGFYAGALIGLVVAVLSLRRQIHCEKLGS